MADVTITLRPNGPLRVEGAIALMDQDGHPIDLQGKTTVALCRCGGSTNKPFCDGQHSKIGFDGAMKAVEASDK